METAASTDSPLATGADTIVIGVFADEGVAHDLPGGALAALLDAGEARRSFKRLALIHHEGRRVLLIGLGPRPEFDGEHARVAAAVAHTRARELGARTLCWELPPPADAGGAEVGEEVVAGLVTGTLLGGYRFTRYKPAPPEEAPVERLLISAPHGVSAAVRRATTIAEAQNRARDLANTAANHLTPTALAEYAAALADRHERLEATILDRTEIRALGMGALLAVSQGSEEQPRLIELRYTGADPEAPWLAMLGKAVTFDSGGLALKPAARMMEMKFDMAGGAAAIETLGALAELGAPVNVLGVVGAVENLAGPGAVKPGDVVTALDGTTIQVDNPDAEGRMVLADCITHARRAGCDTLVDLATLTGAVEAALGWAYAGLMSNDDALAARVCDCGQRSGERVWRLPLDPIYAEMTKGGVAELSNRPEPRVGLASAAAEFLHHFAGEVPWAHLDMLAVAYKGRAPYLDAGGTGWGVRLLVELALSYAA